MTNEELEILKSQLEQGLLLEGTKVEFKENMPRDPAVLAKVLTSMANTDGGIVIIGISERNGHPTIKGISDSDKQVIADSANWINEHFSSGMSLNVYFDSLNDNQYAIIEVSKSEQTVYYSRLDSSPERVVEYTRRGTTISAIFKANYSSLFKYMTLESFILSLNDKSWRFCEPSEWKDQFEKRFYCAKYYSPHLETMAPQLFATCVTRKENNEAAWKVYASGEGLGSHCVQLRLNVIELRKQILNSEFIYYERLVQYKDESFLLNLHKKRYRHYKDYFAPFTKERFLQLLSLKRDAYSYEHEVRLFAEPRHFGKRSMKKQKDSSKYISIIWKDVIKAIKVDSNCSLAELQSLQRGLLYNGIKPVFIGKTKVDDWEDCPFQTFRTIQVEEFDINAMPGPRRIRIR